MNLAYLNGRLVPETELRISVHDLGFVQGVTVAERLRTFGGRLFRLDRHLQRLQHSLDVAEIALPRGLDELADAANRLAAANHARLARDDDLGLTLFVTPGSLGHDEPAGPVVGLHTNPLPFAGFAGYYDHGQPLVITQIRQVPPNCWPPELKCRSRMHYYLADHEARRREAGARALLLDQDGFISEASTANVVFYFEREGLVSPPREKILPGISIGTLAELAAELQIPFVYRDLRPEELGSAQEAMLCSTSPCVYPVSRIDGRTLGQGQPGPVFTKLLAAWSELVGVDIREQARRFSAVSQRFPA